MRRLVVPLLLALGIVGTVRPVTPQSQASQNQAAPSPAVEPQSALWLEIKRQLLGPNGKQYFELVLKDALVPGATDSVHALRGTVLSNKPAKRPSELVLAMSDSQTPEVTITLRDSRENLTPLLKPIAPGTPIEFWGIPVTFTQNPFMLTFEVKAENGPAGANPRMMIKPPPKAKP
jgi:hypothetical protein